MPRKHRAARERTAESIRSERPTTGAPLWAVTPGVDVRTVSAEKTYRCPGCDHEIRPRTEHLVVIPDDAPAGRRHWHTECWRQELRRDRR